MNRKMKHLKLFFLLLVLSSNAIFAQQVNHSQALADLIPTKRWFEIEDYYQLYKDSIDKEFVELWYIAETGIVFNRPFEAINAYEKLIDKNPLNMDMLTLIGLFWQPLLQLCADVQEYAKAKELCQKVITLLENDIDIDSEMRLSYIQGFYKQLKVLCNLKKYIQNYLSLKKKITQKK